MSRWGARLLIAGTSFPVRVGITEVNTPPGPLCLMPTRTVAVLAHRVTPSVGPLSALTHFAYTPTREDGLVDLDRAVRALRAAEAGITRADERAEERARQIKADARAKVDAARADLHAAIVAAWTDGMRQIDIMRATGYSRERVRQILRAGGVEPD